MRKLSAIKPARTPRSTAVAEVATTHADLIISYLARLGIDRVFGVPGGAIEPFLNALARSTRADGPRLVVARHECGAAFMADGYFRETGKMGVVCSTTGPGATNLITGVASAQLEYIPMLVITAQTPLPKFGKRALQESSCTAVDTVGMFRYVTRYNTLVSHSEQLEGKLVAAIMAAYREPYAPVHISIPADILRSESKVSSPLDSNFLNHKFSLADENTIAELFRKIASANNLVVYIGKSVGKASQQLLEFIELTNAAFVTNPMGKTWVDETHPNYCGVYGFAGHESAKLVFQNDKIDLIMAVGDALGELGTSGWNSDLLNRKLVHIDSTIEHFTRSPMANLHVFGDLVLIFENLLVYLRKLHKQGRRWDNVAPLRLKNICGGYSYLQQPEKCLSNAVPLKPQRLMKFLSQALPDDTRIFVDAGNGWAWATHYLTRANAQGFYRIAMGFGAMSWSVGATIGSAIGNPQVPHLCIVGDGSYLMSAQEISVAAQQQLPIIFLILNDAALGMVMHGQQLGQQESIGWELNTINYALMAQAMGIEGIVIETPAQLDALNFAQLFTKTTPTLLDLRIDRNEVPPMGDRIKGLADKSSHSASATPGG
jgi:acetolactate synthase I/II/III large subunit